VKQTRFSFLLSAIKFTNIITEEEDEHSSMRMTKNTNQKITRHGQKEQIVHLSDNLNKQKVIKLLLAVCTGTLAAYTVRPAIT